MESPREWGTCLQVTRKGGYEAFESREGNVLYYAKVESPGIWKVPVEGGEETQVLDHGSYGNWAVLDRGLCLVNINGARAPSLEFFSFTSRRLSTFGSLPTEFTARAAAFSAPAFTVSPSGEWALYEWPDQVESSIEIVENFH